MSETTFTVYAPGAWGDDILPAMESWVSDIEKGQEKGNLYDLVLTGNHLGIPEVLEQYWDGSREVKRGRGKAHRFDLTLAGVRALREEAKYRWEFHGGNGNPYGCEDPDPKCRRAAETLFKRCNEIINGEVA